jgi:hypothetical protein
MMRKQDDRERDRDRGDRMGRPPRRDRDDRPGGFRGDREGGPKFGGDRDGAPRFGARAREDGVKGEE